MAYTIEAAKRSRLIQRVVVSTDSQEIAAIARRFGAEVPFMRPPEISGTHSTEMEFLRHGLGALQDNEGYDPDLIVLLYPTAPFRKSSSIDCAIEEMLKHPEADSLRSIRLCSEHPCKMWVMEGGYLRPFVKEKDPAMPTWSYQSLPAVYVQNANIYITKPATLRDKKSPIGDVVLPFVMDAIESIDINEPLDFQTAEMLIQRNPGIIESPHVA
jgi:N-acylneuraminate cytidylyltransferase